MVEHLADAIEHLGDFQRGGPGGPGGPGHFGGPPPGLADAAKALDVSEDKLDSYLRAHKTAAEIAKATGKTEAQVTKALPFLGHDRGGFGHP